MRKYSLILIFLLVLAPAIGCKGSSTEKIVTQESPKINWFRKDGSINWEAEKEQRQIKTDTIVIHHTGDKPATAWQRLSEIQFKSVYVPRFNSDNPEPYVKGMRVQSGHFREENGNRIEVFYTYHWLIRKDGKTERLLNDNEVGWHSGDWVMNCRSIALCFDGNFSTKPPSEAALKACAQIIAEYAKKFPDIAKNPTSQVIGHYDIKNTECPGEWFRQGEKEKLIEAAGLRQSLSP